MRVQPCDAAVAVDEWMDPRKVVMRTRHANQQRFGPGQSSIPGCPRFNEPCNVFPRWGQAATGRYAVVPKLPGNDWLASVGMPVGFRQFAVQQSVNLADDRRGKQVPRG